MSKATYEQMTRKELREYLKGNRNNSEAWEVFFDKNNEVGEKIVFPYTESPEETEAQVQNILKRKQAWTLEKEKVEQAIAQRLLERRPRSAAWAQIALLKSRKRDGHIDNPAGFLVAALKENWASQINTNQDKGATFRYWYQLARELGYCQSQEVRDNEQWVLLSGNWEKWQSAVNRGYSV